MATESLELEAQCDQHDGENATVVCIKHSGLLCLTCLLDKTHTSEDCEMREINKIASNKERTTVQILSMKQHLKKKINNLNQHMMRVESGESRLKEDIDQFHDDIIKIVYEMRARSIEAVDAKINLIKQRLTEDNNFLDKMEETLTEHLNLLDDTNAETIQQGLKKTELEVAKIKEMEKLDAEFQPSEKMKCGVIESGPDLGLVEMCELDGSNALFITGINEHGYAIPIRRNMSAPDGARFSVGSYIEDGMVRSTSADGNSYQSANSQQDAGMASVGHEWNGQQPEDIAHDESTSSNTGEATATPPVVPPRLYKLNGARAKENIQTNAGQNPVPTATRTTSFLRSLLRRSKHDIKQPERPDMHTLIEPADTETVKEPMKRPIKKGTGVVLSSLSRNKTKALITRLAVVGYNSLVLLDKAHNAVVLADLDGKVICNRSFNQPLDLVRVNEDVVAVLHGKVVHMTILDVKERKFKKVHHITIKMSHTEVSGFGYDGKSQRYSVSGSGHVVILGYDGKVQEIKEYVDSPKPASGEDETVTSYDFINNCLYILKVNNRTLKCFDFENNKYLWKKRYVKEAFDEPRTMVQHRDQLLVTTKSAILKVSKHDGSLQDPSSLVSTQGLLEDVFGICSVEDEDVAVVTSNSQDVATSFTLAFVGL